MLDHSRVGLKSKVALVVLTLLGVASVVGSAVPPAIDRRNFEVIGLTLFKDEVQDAENRLGQASVFHSPDSHFPERCYASSGKDGTALILEDWAGTLVGFQIVDAAPT